MKHLDRCPEKEVLEKFLNHELADDMNDNIFSHVQLCDNCKNTIKCLLSDERNLLKSLFNEPVSSEDRKVQPSDACLSKAAILAYANECLGKNQLKLVESHLEKCDNCLNSLIVLQKSMALPLEVEFDTTAVLAAHKEAKKSRADILEIALKVKNDILELINHTGELLSLTPQLGTVRGEGQQTEQSIVIRKDLKDKDLSVEITVNKELVENQNNVKVSIMRLSIEEFIRGMDVSLSGKDVSQHGQTNEEGIAEFCCDKKGTYAINIAGVEVSLLTIE
jgi:hypothetical protein